MTSIDIMGDPHLAKTFVHGVPLHRRGEREAMVWEAFRANLEAAECDLHVCMGDLFERPIVPYDAILKAADIYRKVASDKSQTRFVILRGNHDCLLRDLERASAFDLVARLVSDVPNIIVVSDVVMIEGYLFVGYDPVTPLADRITEDHRGAKAAFFHAETEGYGKDFNVIPFEKLAELDILEVYNGHEHKPARFTKHGVDVTVVGSLQPYSHGEEIDDTLYVTLTLSELETAGDLSNKCVRVLLEPGETLDQEIDCLQMTIKRTADAEAEIGEVTLGEFDIDALFKQAFAEANVSENLTDEMLQRFHERRLAGEA
ncbi:MULTISPECIES: metallophosphoesterase [Marivita]|uniref:Metallophosphoesterase n=1 Tax=Marivita cryptomonadis TaxID=505252 RepID=A0A9Q2NTN6_9RHOB|nr:MULTISPECIES: metallophosphoesterase [Marivita]MCR9168735.1 metallophosphoesterase [Paracoccaceae bacterium]MBM2321024.1 metallophosphoesterase [Marivita cryptomonadis]MBM2330605.1 metallophosphoesterase [Marivita cryptomonadis]MBM2340191.1 metallophosphoesterase [Marivita cryptomonadis]MBM2344853.1 metallophosphoesterase [Marivita cryptomonadis]